MILEADVLNDPRLVEWLREVGPFDGVACWLVGSHGLRSLYMNEDGTTVRKPTLYRLQVQNRVYELADSILRPGGILHVVDRGTMPSDEEKKRSLLESHREQASPTSLVVESADWRPVESFDTPGGVKMEPGEVSRKDPPERVEWAFESVISRKLDVGMLK